MTKRILFLIAAVTSFVIVLQSNSFAESLPIFGPAKYSRTTGAPNSLSNLFRSCNTGATYKVVVENGEAGKERVSSGVMSLNGQEIINQSDFSQKVDKIEKTVNLQPENMLDIKLASGPSGFIKVSVFCVTNCLEVKITSPVTGNTINKSKTIIRGDLYNAFSETGVVLQSLGTAGDASSSAQAQGTKFAGSIPLQQGQNIITATATDSCGYKTTDTVTINTQTPDEKIRLTTNPESGIPALDVTLEAEAYLPIAISNYSWDTDGDSMPDHIGPALAKVKIQYQTPGIYFPKVIIADTQGNTYTETTIVSVFSKEEMDALLKGKWDGMKTALASGTIEGAVNYFAKRSRDSYRQQFTALAQRLPQIAADMGAITIVNIRGNAAEYDLRTVRNGTTYTFQLKFERDTDGIWRIRSF